MGSTDMVYAMNVCDVDSPTPAVHMNTGCILKYGAVDSVMFCITQQRKLTEPELLYCSKVNISINLKSQIILKNSDMVQHSQRDSDFIHFIPVREITTQQYQNVLLRSYS